MTGPKNSFPRGSTSPSTSPAEQSAKNASGWKKTPGNLDRIAGEGHNDKPKLRGVEANTADGRGSRCPTTGLEDTSSTPGKNGTGEVDPYGGQPVGTHSQGGVGGVR